ncbi:MAG: NUDIX hydrolase [Slackia sp.]|nr:NUDIX hydrolase [Slackia sp.]
MGIREDIRTYVACNEQEAVDKRAMMQALDNDPTCFERSAQAHMTASAWTVDARMRRVLAVYHNLYRSWSWIGGHADGERDLAAVALRELREETGIEHARIVAPEASPIFSLETLAVNGHEKRGAYVAPHLHFNVTYLIVADENDAVRIKPDENSAVRWIDLDEMTALSSEPWMRERVYRKLIDKTRAIARRL